MLTAIDDPPWEITCTAYWHDTGDDWVEGETEDAPIPAYVAGPFGHFAPTEWQWSWMPAWCDTWVHERLHD